MTKSFEEWSDEYKSEVYKCYGAAKKSSPKTAECKADEKTLEHIIEHDLSWHYKPRKRDSYSSLGASVRFSQKQHIILRRQQRRKKSSIQVRYICC